MKQEDKNLLLQDLCSRLPYGIKVHFKFEPDKGEEFESYGILESINNYSQVEIDSDKLYGQLLSLEYNEVKPYLFPLSSMTEEQKRKYNSLRDFVPTYHYEYGDIVEDTELYDNWKSIDYLIANHFDYRGLIPMGLAIDCTNLNIY